MLIEKKNLRLLQRRHEKRQSLPLSAGQEADLCSQPILETKIKNLELLSVLHPLPARDAPAERAPLAASGCKRHILIDLHISGRTRHRILKYTPEIDGALVFAQPRYVLPVNDDRTGIDRPYARDRVHDRRFSGSVSTDDRAEVTVLQREADVDQRALLIDRPCIKGLVNVL